VKIADIGMTEMRIICLLEALLLVSGPACKTSSQTFEAEANRPKSYSGSGVVEQVIAKERRVTIHHKEIPNFMPEMTMDFNVKDTNELQGVSPGAEITFRLLVLQNDAWIENIHCVGNGKPVAAQAVAASGSDSRLKVGDVWPDGELLDERGRLIHFSDFRGQILAFTFFFTRCPLPDYCPRLNHNFAETWKHLSAAPSARTNFCFLSISFDPDFDTPENLSSYAQNYRGSDPEGWLFAVASTNTLAKLPAQLGLLVRRQGSGIAHNLRTVVLDSDGRVYRQFDGNEWTSQQLASAIEEAGQQGKAKGSQ
jgi:protein SCO1